MSTYNTVPPDLWRSAVELSEGAGELLQALLLLIEQLIEKAQLKLEHEVRHRIRGQRDAAFNRTADHYLAQLQRLAKNLEALRIEAENNPDPTAVIRLATMLILEMAELLGRLDRIAAPSMFPERLANFRKVPLQEINRILGKSGGGRAVSQETREEEESHKAPAATLKPAPRKFKP